MVQDRKSRFCLHSRWCTIELNCDGVPEEEVVLRITISTVINTIQSMSGLNVECGMSVGCNNELTGKAQLKKSYLLWSGKKSFNHCRARN